MLALLYFGHDVLIPFTVVLMLGLLITPLVRSLRRVGLGSSPFGSRRVLISAFVVTATAGVLGTQILQTAPSPPQYERTIQQELRNLDDVTVGRFNALMRGHAAICPCWTQRRMLLTSHPGLA